MTWLVQLILAVAMASLLYGCGAGYEEKPARITVEVKDSESKQQLFYSVWGFLHGRGFDYLGRYDEMIALIKQNTAMPTDTRTAELDRLDRERTFLDDDHQMRIVWTDYSKRPPDDLKTLGYQEPDGPFVEIVVYEERPGGFSSEGLLFFNEFRSSIQSKIDAPLVVVAAPPPTNNSDYWKITIANGICTIIWSSIALLISLACLGAASFFVLRRVPLSNSARRGIFIVINTWFVAPLPLNGGMFRIIGPNILAFPWTDVRSYAEPRLFAVVSFPCTLLICIWISKLFFGNRTNRNQQNIVQAVA